jgi:hypothetical protein
MAPAASVTIPARVEGRRATWRPVAATTSSRPAISSNSPITNAPLDAATSGSSKAPSASSRIRPPQRAVMRARRSSGVAVIVHT